MKIHQPVHYCHIAERSRFLASLFPCGQESDFLNIYKQTKTEHYNANHHCFAYICSGGSRHSDDGEPSGTAGFPLLNCLLRHDLQDAGLIVTRYFGGIKLGKPGLLRAYTAAGEEVLKKAELYEEYPLDIYEISLPYDLAERFRLYASQYAQGLEMDYGEEVLLRFALSPGTSLAPYLSLSHGKKPLYRGQRLQERKVNS